MASDSRDQRAIWICSDVPCRDLYRIRTEASGHSLAVVGARAADGELVSVGVAGGAGVHVDVGQVIGVGLPSPPTNLRPGVYPLLELELELELLRW